MSKILVRKHFMSLRPIDEAGEQVLRKIRQDKILSVDIVQTRNIHHHRKFFALMNLVYENLDSERYPSLDDFVGAIKIATGHRTRIEMPNGDVGFIPKSISFAKMNQAEFDEFYNRTIDLICQYFIPGLDPGGLRNELENICGVAC